MLEYILLFGSAFILGWKLREYYARRLIDEMFKNAKQEEHDDWVILNVEKHEDMFYLYEESGKFVAQGRSRKELVEILQKIYPNNGVRIYSDNAEEIGFK